MATSGSNRDVKLTLSVDTLGEEGVKSLQASVLSLAQQGGSAAPEFQKLADEIARLGEQNQALQSFKTLGDETAELRDKQVQVVASSEDMRTKLEALRQTTAGLESSQTSATAAYRAANLANVEAGNAIRVLKTEYDSAGKGTEKYRTELNRLTVAQAETKVELTKARDAQRDANAAVSEAESAQNRLEKSYKSSVAAVERNQKALTDQEATLKEAAASAAALGVATDDVAAAEGQLLSAFNRAGAAAQTRADVTRDMVEADRLLAVEERSLIALLAQGQDALQAETLAQRDAARAAEDYFAAKQQATANAAAWQQEAEGIVNTAEAAQALARQTEILAAAATELGRQRAFEQQAADAQKLVQAADYVRVWEQALEQAEVQARETAEVAAAAANRIETAFSTVGVRSAQELQTEITQVRAAMVTLQAQATTTGSSLSGAFAAGEAKIKSLERDLRELNGTLTTGDKAAALFANSMGQITAGNLAADAIGALINKVKEMGVAFIAAIVQLDQMRRGLNAIYGDARTTASQIDFLRRTAGDAGVSFGGLSKEFVKFSASMQGANIPLSQSNALFKAVTTASATLGLGAEETAGSLNALGQMASKGVVSMEELRQQLGDRLPGAFGLVAKGLTLTEGELVKLVESGGLAARNLFPALTRALGEMKGETDGLVPNFERLKGALTDAAQASGDAVWTNVLAAGLKGLTAVTGIVAGGFLGLSNAIGLAGSSAAIFFGPGLGSYSERMVLFREELDKAAERQSRFSDAIDRAIDPTKAAGAAQQAMATALSAGTAASIAAAKGAVDLTSSQKLQQIATTLAGDSALDTSTKYVRLTQEANNLLATQQQQTVAAEKLAKAAKIEGDSLVQLAELRGNETETLEAAIVASSKYAAKMVEVAASRAQETAILEAQLVALEANRVAQGLRVEDIKVEKDALDKKLVASQAETEQSKQAAEASRLDSVQRKITADTYRDNSARVEEFRQTLSAAVLVLSQYQARAAAGLATDQEVSVAKERVAVAQRLYNDAVGDSVAKIELQTRAQTANLSIEAARAGALETAYNLQAKSSAAIGDSAAALYYEIEAKKASIEQTRIMYEIKKLEATADIQALEIQKLQIPANDALREQKLQEIEIRIQLAKVKLAEAGASDAIISAMEREIAAMRNNAGQRSSTSAGISTDTSARLANATAIDKQTAALEKQNLTSDGFKKNADGSAAGTFTNTLAVDKAFALTNQASKGGDLSGVSLADAAAAFQQAKAALDYMQKINAQAPGSNSLAFTSSTTALYNSTKAAYEKVQALAAEKARQASAATAATTTTTSSTTTSSKTVNVVINGKSTAINVASDTDASALTAMIRQLETAANSAT